MAKISKQCSHLPWLRHLFDLLQKQGTKVLCIYKSKIWKSRNKKEMKRKKEQFRSLPLSFLELPCFLPLLNET